MLHILYASIGAGLPFTTSAVVDVTRSGSVLAVELALHAGAQELKLTLQRRLHNSTEIAGGLLVSVPCNISQFNLNFLIMWLVFSLAQLVHGGTDCLYF